ncbi:hypothetical protein Tco_1054440 [Tanacetum coccineum]|uniref:DDE-1 domain-containing protein n=1 Tax=Tanacetum coccineum TaxID=301880 RepID=A0ABQ5GWS4_9ASTR
MVVLDSCPKHNMVAYTEFHEVIDFLVRSSIHHALTLIPVVSTTFVEQFWTSAKSKIINNVRYITAKVAGKDQAKEITHLKAQIKKLKKQAKHVITHHRAWMKSVSLEQRLAGKKALKKNWMQRESVSKQGRKSAKAEPSVHRNPLFDELPDDTMDYIDTEDAQDEGRTRDVLNEEKETTDDKVSTEDVVSTDRPNVSTDRPNVSTDRPKVSTDKDKDSTVSLDEAKAVSREKEKGVELKDVEETERPRPTSTRSLLTLKPLPKIDPKDKGKKKIEEEEESDTESEDIPEAKKKFNHIIEQMTIKAFDPMLLEGEPIMEGFPWTLLAYPIGYARACRCSFEFKLPVSKTEGNVEFHEVIDFLARSSIHHALIVSLVVSTTFVEQFWMSVKSKIINNVRYITAKVAGKPVSISEASIRSDLLFDDADGIDSLPNQAIFDAIQLMGYEGDLTVLTFNKALFSPQWSKANVEPQSDPSPRPSPTPHIPDSILEVSGGNHGGQSSSDKSLSGNEGDMTLQSVYDLCISLCTQVTDQAKEIKHLKAQIKKLKKQAKPVITHHRAWMKSISLKQRLARKKTLKANWMQRESVSKQGRKSAKAEPLVHKDPLFDELDDYEIDNMDTEDAQDVGRIREVVDEEKEGTKYAVSTEDVVSTDKEKVSTDISKDSTDKEEEGADKDKDSTVCLDEGTDDQTEARSTTPITSTTTPTIFGDDETIAQVLLNMSQAKAILKEKEKGVELKDVEETERPRPTSTRSLLTLKPLPKIDPKDKGKKKIKEEVKSDTESEDILKAEKKFKQLARDEELARKLQEDWETEEERKRLAEEEATKTALSDEYDFIQARIEADRLLAPRLQDEERERESSSL